MAAIEPISVRSTTVYAQVKRDRERRKFFRQHSFKRRMVVLPDCPYVRYSPGGTSSSARQHGELSCTMIRCAKRKIVLKGGTVMVKETFVIWRG